jgi:hypothetical protein
MSRVARSGELRREEWTEQGRARALILRPDINKVFLLDLDKQVYTELALSPGGGPPQEPDPHGANGPPSTAADGEPSARQGVSPGELERAFNDAPSPARITTRALPDQTIENHPCKVFEQRASFEDGRTEITRVFQATDFHDLAVRIESESEGGPRVVTERRDLKASVSPGEFVVPAGFKRVEKLAR